MTNEALQFRVHWAYK
jgi:hypothetical protein